MQTFQEFNEGILDLLTKKGREKRGVEKAELALSKSVAP